MMTLYQLHQQLLKAKMKFSFMMLRAVTITHSKLFFTTGMLNFNVKHLEQKLLFLHILKWMGIAKLQKLFHPLISFHRTMKNGKKVENFFSISALWHITNNSLFRLQNLHISEQRYYMILFGMI